MPHRLLSILFITSMAVAPQVLAQPRGQMNDSPVAKAHFEAMKGPREEMFKAKMNLFKIIKQGGSDGEINRAFDDLSAKERELYLLRGAFSRSLTPEQREKLAEMRSMRKEKGIRGGRRSPMGGWDE